MQPFLENAVINIFLAKKYVSWTTSLVQFQKLFQTLEWSKN